MVAVAYMLYFWHGMQWMMYILAYGGFGVYYQTPTIQAVIIVDSQMYYYSIFFNSIFSFVRYILVK
jgi:hypothetical protein